MNNATPSGWTDRRAAIVSGILFLNAILFLFVGEALYRPWLNPIDLDGVTANRGPYILGITVEWIASVPLILMIPVLLYPIFARYSRRGALAYLALRLMEVTMLSVADIKKLTIVDLAGWTDRAAAMTQAEATLAEAAWMDSAGMIYNLTFGASALVLFGILLGARLVPVIISAWGLFATVVLMVGSVAFIFGMFPASWGPVFWGPIALAEVGLALWLIIKGLATNQ